MKKLYLIILFFVISLFSSYAQIYKEKYIKDASEIALSWLNDINDESYESAYNGLAIENKNQYPKEIWIKLINELMIEFGKLNSRSLISKNFKSSIEGVEDGFYVLLEFKSDYKKTKNHKEFIILKQNDQTNWVILDYNYEFNLLE
tara:strand:+ start:8034 stop:8471 length:438 start_codon:yes stop_codon:yes gene_type:complete